MKVYQVNYDNGRDYSDHIVWVGEKVYANKEDALQELFDEGFLDKGNSITELHFGESIVEIETDIYERESAENIYDAEYAFIKELELIGG